MSPALSTISVFLKDEAETIRLGEDLTLALKPGDCLALSGDLGAGKSTLARAFIRAMAEDAAIEVPSPTFTIVQSYALRIPVHHLDLYRLVDLSELDELGLDEMLSDGICLIEWPEIAGDDLPAASTFSLRLEHSRDGRVATIDAPAKQTARLERVLAIRQFLIQSGHSTASRRFLSGDASLRAYERIIEPGRPQVILMDWPRLPKGPAVYDGKPYADIAHLAQDAYSFVAIANYLRHGGFAAPEIYATDFEQGLLLIEYLGHDGIVDADGEPIAERYMESVGCLARLHATVVPENLPVSGEHSYQIPPFDLLAMKIETSLLVDWYLPWKRGGPVSETERAEYLAIWDQLIAELADAEKNLLLRDFHSPNIIWRPQEDGLARIGLIDFQDAMIGPTAYDLASIVQDARVNIPPALADRLMSHYFSLRQADPGFDKARFQKAWAIMAAQRNCKLAGIWVRLLQRDGKPGYLKHMPRTLDYLRTAFQHDSLAPLRDWCVRAGIDIGDPIITRTT